MSNKYKHGDRVPNNILADRFDELADAVTKGRDSINREFYMSVPAQLDNDADLVLSQAAKRLREFDRAYMTAKQHVEVSNTEHDVDNL